MDEIPINPQTGRPVTRFVKAKHRDLTREVILKRTGEVVVITAHNYDPTLHTCRPPDAPELPELPEPRPVKAAKKKTSKKKTRKKTTRAKVE
jgi:hypothetical protein